MRQAGISFRAQDEAKKDIKKLEAALEDCASALRVIHTWATSQNGVALNDARSVVKLCRRVLDDIPDAESIRAVQDSGRKPGAGTGRTVTTSSINLPPELWAKLDAIRGDMMTRSAWIAAKIKQARK